MFNTTYVLETGIVLENLVVSELYVEESVLHIGVNPLDHLLLLFHHVGQLQYINNALYGDKYLLFFHRILRHIFNVYNFDGLKYTSQVDQNISKIED